MIETEQAILGCVLNDSTAYHRAKAVGLGARHFGSVRNSIVWRAIEDLGKANEAIDLITVRDRLNVLGQIDRVGGSGYLSQLDLDMPDPSNLETYIDQVKAGAVRRVTVDAGKSLSRIEENTFSVDQLLEQVQENVAKIMSMAEGSLRVTRMDDAINRLVEQLEDGIPPGLSTGYPSLDALLGGLRPGNLVIIAGRPGMGKTSLATNMMHMQALTGKSAGLFSLEMSAGELSMRMLSTDSEIPHQKIKAGALNQEEWNAIARSRARIAQLPILIEDSGGLTVSKLAAKARELTNIHKLDVIYVDYLQLMGHEGRSTGNRNLEISEITRGMKGLARSLDIPVVVLSQLSRGVESRTDKRPRLSDLRDSGSIEQDADSVMFVYRKGYYQEVAGKVDTTNGVTEVIVAKNRSGPQGRIHLVWDGQRSRFLAPS